MPIKNGGTFRAEDVTLLLTDITGLLEPIPTHEREHRIQSGVHYSEMLPLEYKATEKYIAEYNRALNEFANETARAVVDLSEKIIDGKGDNVVLISLARAGIPAGILIKRYLNQKYKIDVPHYAISIVRGRGIDENAMNYILSRHKTENIQFVDGWTGKGAILNELITAFSDYCNIRNRRKLLAVLADPANITDICGTHEDIPIASSFLNSTVCGLMSRTVIRPGIGKSEFHGVAFYEELRNEDRTYDFIEHIESSMAFSNTAGIDEITEIAVKFGVTDINFIKPGIGEATRVLLRRLPDILLIAENAEPRFIAHILQLAEEKSVPVIRYPLRHYKACGIIKSLGADA
jgi:hypothetical protein